MKKYLVQRYQLVYSNSGRDTVNLNPPVMVFDLEEYRKSVRKEYPNAIGVNLTFVEMKEGV